MSGILVVGDGPAAHRLAERLRGHGHTGPLTVLGAEPAHHRPLLTDVVAGRLPAEAVRLPPLPDTRVSTGTVVTGIDRARHEVRARQGGTETVHPYDTLVLATGARPVVPDIVGATGGDGHLAAGVTTLRTASDCARITGETVVVLGGGPLGVETASALAARGTDTTLICAHPHPLHERLGETCAALLTETLEQAGVTMLGGRTVVRRTPDRVLLDDGTNLRADTLVLCTGAAPDVRLARAAGLRVRTGIVVDDRLRTSDPHIHALGDCAELHGRAPGGVDTAWAQADALAAILTGHATVHRPTPTVFRLRTRFADVSCVGDPADFDRPRDRTVTLTDQANRRHARLALRDGHLVAAVLFGVPEAIAALGIAHRYGRPVPSDLLGLLLGPPARPAPVGSETDEDALVCLCNNVRRPALMKAWQSGARTVTALAGATRAATGCGGCGPLVARLCDDWEHEARPAAELAR